ncbi:MAG: sulfotransferase [Cyanobacteria bacterium J06614_10]
MNIPSIDYLVIGSPKCATTTMCKLLEQHPEVYMSQPKEPRFFCPAVPEEKQSWEWYSSLFEGVTSEKVIGEGTVNYTASDYRSLVDPQLIHSYYPGIKLIYMVRDPIERIESHWLSHAIMGWPQKVSDFDIAVRTSSVYINTSRYWSHFNRFRRFFDDSQFHIIFFEDFVKSPETSMAVLFEFLGVDPYFQLKDAGQNYNKATEKRFRDSNLTRMLRSMGVIEGVRQLIPRPLYKHAIPFLKQKNVGRPAWKDETLAWAINELRDDSLRFLSYCNKPDDFWKSYANDQKSCYGDRFTAFTGV